MSGQMPESDATGPACECRSCMTPLERRSAETRLLIDQIKSAPRLSTSSTPEEGS